MWAIGADGVVLRIDPEVNEVVARIPTVKVGSLPGGSAAGVSVAATSTAVWAVSGGHFSVPQVFRIDPATNLARPFVATGNAPTAVAVGFGDLWVSDSFENTVTRVDPAGVVVAPIPVGHGPIAVAVGKDAVWVADSLDDAVVRIDPETNSVVDTIPVGRSPSSIAVEDGSVWVGNRHDGTVSRIDPEKNEVVDTIEIASSPAGLAVAAGSLWVTSQAGVGSALQAASGGVARFSAAEDFETDPARYPDRQINYATCAKLLNYPDAPAPAGTRLVPEVAASLPRVSSDGRTYTFTVRSGFAFSPPRRERVTAETFKYAIERSLHPRMGVAGSFVHDLAGQAAYQAGTASHISGVVAEGNRLSGDARRAGGRLPRPDGDLVLLRRAVEHADRPERRARDPVGRALLHRGARAEAADRPQAEPELPRIASAAPAGDPLLDRPGTCEERRRRRGGKVRLSRRRLRSSERRSGGRARRSIRPRERRGAERQTAVLRQPTPRARVPRLEHEPAALLGRAPAKGGQLRDRPARPRPPRESRHRPVPRDPHRSVPPPGDARREPHGSLPAFGRPAAGASAGTERARNCRSLHLQFRVLPSPGARDPRQSRCAGPRSGRQGVSAQRDVREGEYERRAVRHHHRPMARRLGRSLHVPERPPRPADHASRERQSGPVRRCALRPQARPHRPPFRRSPLPGLRGTVCRAGARRGAVGGLCHRHRARLLLGSARLPGVPPLLRHRPRSSLHPQ